MEQVRKVERGARIRAKAFGAFGVTSMEAVGVTRMEDSSDLIAEDREMSGKSCREQDASDT